MKKIGYVYFITNQLHTGIKIGFTCDLNRRLKELQTANSEKLEILYYVKGTRDTESYFHNYFSSVYNIRNEWYQFDFVWIWIKRDKLEKKVLKQEGLISN